MGMAAILINGAKPFATYPQSFLDSGDEDFKYFYHNMDMLAILFNGAEPFEQIVNTLSTEGPMWNLLKIAQAVLKEIKKLHNFIHVYSPGAKADNPQGTKFWL